MKGRKIIIKRKISAKVLKKMIEKNKIKIDNINIDKYSQLI